MATPYYERGGISIYHGDCREILPSLPKFDLLLTDPPYGINADKDANNVRCQSWKTYPGSGWDKERPSLETFELLLASAEDAIVWGGNYFADLLPPSMGWLSWDKNQVGFSLANFELAWTSYWAAARCVVLSRGRARMDPEQGLHPTQKPLDVMRWCIEHADGRAGAERRTIIDPFMGSGTTLRAAKDLGRSVVGIEAVEEYCEIAANRLRQEVFDFSS